MSYGIMAYAVDLDAIRTLLGSGDKQAFAILRRQHARELEDLDRDLGNPGDPQDLPTGKILYRLIMEPELPTDLTGVNRAKLLYAFEILCRARGQSLDNEYWSGMRWSWFDTVDAELKRLGVNFAVSDLTVEMSGLHLPRADDFPAVGIWSRKHCQAGLVKLQAAPLEQLDDEEVRESVEQIKTWFQTCVDRNVDLVCFYY